MSKDAKEFHPTTQEDLDNIPPMGKTQKIVILVAALFVAVCVIYYFASGF